MGKKGRRGATTSKSVIKRTQRKQTAHRYLRPQFTNDSIAEVWDPSKSARQNLSNIGLAHDPNKSITHGNPNNILEMSSKLKAVSNTPCQMFDIPQSDNLRGGDINMKRRALPQLEVDQKYASKCLMKHGTKYKEMARDIKTNNKQYTPAQLKKVCSRFILLDDAQRLAPLPPNLSA